MGLNEQISSGSPSTLPGAPLNALQVGLFQPSEKLLVERLQ
jgi:hypothetical protein